MSRWVALVLLASLLVVQGLAASPAWHHLLHVEQGSAAEHHHEGSGDSDDESGCPVALFVSGAVDHGMAEPFLLGEWLDVASHPLARPAESGALCGFLLAAVWEHAPPRG